MEGSVYDAPKQVRIEILRFSRVFTINRRNNERFVFSYGFMVYSVNQMDQEVSSKKWHDGILLAGNTGPFDNAEPFFVPMTTLLASPRLRNYEFVPKYLFATGLLVAGRKGFKRRSIRTPSIARTCMSTDFGFDIIES